MKNFVFHNPVKVIFGRNTLSQTGAEAQVFGKNVLLVCGMHSVFHSGVYAQVCESLKNAGLTLSTLSGIRPNPLLSKVHEGIEIARTNDSHLIIGLGGGSVMDTAKAIAAGVHAKHDVWKFFTGKKSVKETLPVISIPTIAGSGSEMNSGIVLTDDNKQLKFGFAHRKLYPRVCIADPVTTFSVSPQLTAYGAVDAMTHCLEAYFTTDVFETSRFQTTLMENICTTIIKSCQEVRENPEFYDARASLLWAGSIALSGLPTAGIGRISFPMHLLSHAISTLMGTSHGASLAAVLPGWIRYQHSAIQDRLARFGISVFNLPKSSEEKNSIETINALQTFLSSIDCPTTLSEIGIREDQFAALQLHCLAQAKIWRMSDYNGEKIMNILTSCK